MTLGQLLHKHKQAIAERWLDDALATYPGDAAVAFKNQKDPFANPVGHSLRVATQSVFAALLDGKDDDEICQLLHEVVKIRAVQQFSASQAVDFIFRLKEAVRAGLGKAASDPQYAGELADFDRRIDRMALAAFDFFVKCREEVWQLRVNEVKRRVAWVLEKMGQRGLGPELVEIDLE